MLMEKMAAALGRHLDLFKSTSTTHDYVAERVDQIQIERAHITHI